MNKLLFLLMFSLFFGTFSTTLWCNEPNNPIGKYEIEVPVTTPTLGNPKEFINEAFKNILIQLSGSEEILKSPDIAKAMQNPDKYVERYAFLEKADSRFLRVQFNDSLMKELLGQQSGAANDPQSSSTTTTPEKPITLIWLITDMDKPQWINQENHKEWLEQMELQAKEHTMKIVFPLLDLEDTTIVSEDSIIKQDWESLQKASERYHANSLLVGKIRGYPGKWEAEWTIVSNGKANSFESQAQEIETLWKNVLEDVSIAYLQEKGTIDADNNMNESDVFTLSISGINGGENYTKVLDYLKKLPTVSAVEVAEINGDATVFNLPKASREIVLNKIAEDRILQQNMTSSVNPNRVEFSLSGT